jgi:hypothetical protein
MCFPLLPTNRRVTPTADPPYGCGLRPRLACSIRKNPMSEPLPPWLANVDPRFVRPD